MTATEPLPPERPILLAQGDLASLESLALVLESVGIAYHLEVNDRSLWVNGEDAANALEQLQLYQEENVNWPPVAPAPDLHPEEPPTALVVGGLVLFHLVTGNWSTNSAWFTQGAVDTDALVGRGEWWRLVTALTLHADAVHLVGNCLLGGVLIHLLSRLIGYGSAWFLLVAMGSLGNWCNVIWRHSPHLSVGFSTAVFAAVGILSGVQAVRRRTVSWKDLMLPLGAGLALLALLGTEGERTDLGAHFFGFVCGLGAGMLIGATSILAWCRPALGQRLFFALTFAIVLLCWWRAMV
nr:rhomboid family intramembrane serine protease [uncultured Desulfobulbus sp.]